MKILNYIVYVIYKGYDKLSPPGHDNYWQMIYAVAVLDLFLLFLIVDSIFPHLLAKFPNNKLYILITAVLFGGFHFFIFRSQKWWLNKFVEFDLLPKKLNIVLATFVGIFIALVFGTVAIKVIISFNSAA
jgi:hypothetical protein